MRAETGTRLRSAGLARWSRLRGGIEPREVVEYYLPRSFRWARFKSLRASEASGGGTVQVSSIEQAYERVNLIQSNSQPPLGAWIFSVYLPAGRVTDWVCTLSLMPARR
jgi:hypothetical protein